MKHKPNVLHAKEGYDKIIDIIEKGVKNKDAKS